MTIFFAHGAGSAMDTPFMEWFATRWADAGLQVVRFEFPYMAQLRSSGRRAPPDPAKVLENTFLEVVAAERGGAKHLVLAGKSMGGRIATQVAERTQADLVIALGYPFHPPKQPTKLRTAHLTTLRTPCLIVQGTRDPFGTPAEVATYGLSPQIALTWIEDGDHSLEPRKRSGRSTAQCLDEALTASTAKIRALFGA